MSRLSAPAEAAVVAFRVHTQLPLDGVYVGLRSSIPALTRSTLHRSLQRQGVSRLPRAPEQRGEPFKAYDIGYFHLDVADVRAAREKGYLFRAADRTSKPAFARLYRRATGLVAAASLAVLAKPVPYRVHTVPTDNGIQFSDAGGKRVLPSASSTGSRSRTTPGPTGTRSAWPARSSKRRCGAFHYDGLGELRQHVADYLAAYDFARHLTALRWRTPYETLAALWGSRPELFRRSADHLTLRPNT